MDHCYDMLVIYRCLTRIIATHSCSTSIRYTTALTTAYQCTCHIIVIIITWNTLLTVTHACMVSVIWIPVHITCIIVPCYYIHVIWLFPVTDMDILVTGLESCWYAICGIPHLLFPFPVILFPIYCSRFPLYCSMLSTELWSSYHVTRILYCICSCYIVYLTYQIIKLTWVWGRLDGWLDLIGWCTGSILFSHCRGW